MPYLGFILTDPIAYTVKIIVFYVTLRYIFVCLHMFSIEIFLIERNELRTKQITKNQKSKFWLQ